MNEPALAREPHILDALAADLDRAGLLAERVPIAKLVFLATVSRLHASPVSVAIKGPSSAGKSWLLRQVLAFFPTTAFWELSAMSSKALVYSEEPLAHRMLVLCEADGMPDAEALLRTLLSEGRLRYSTVESTKDGLRAREIEREGPTGFLTTTTAIRLHAENETRYLSVTVSDTPEQAAAVFLRWGEAVAGGQKAPVDYTRWHTLSDWLEEGEREVVIPYGPILAKLMPPRALRLQRDFVAVLSLVKAHTLLHRATRKRDGQARILAALTDYGAVRELAEPLIAQGVEASVKPTVRATVEAVAALAPEHPEGVSQTAVRQRLNLDRGTASRRVRDAIAAGYLLDQEDRHGHPSRLRLADPLPDDGAVLPTVEALERCPSPAETPPTAQHRQPGGQGRSL